MSGDWTPEMIAAREEDIRTAVREIPLAWNGYVPVAQYAERVPASEVKRGDILVLDGFVSLVHQDVEQVDVQPPYKCMAFWIRGDVNIIRFGNEVVSVIRRGGVRSS